VSEPSTTDKGVDAPAAASEAPPVFGGRRPRRVAPSVSPVDFRNPSRPTGSKLAALEEFARGLGGRLAGAFSGLLQARIPVEAGSVRSGSLRDLLRDDLSRATALTGPGGAIGACLLDDGLEEHLSLRLLGVPPVPEEEEATGETASTPESEGAPAETESPQGLEGRSPAPSEASPAKLERTPMVRAALRSAMSTVLEATNAALAESGGGGFRLRESAGIPEATLAESEPAHAFDVVVREGKAGGKLALVLPERALRSCVEARDRVEPPTPDPAAARLLESVVRGLELGVTARLGEAEVSLFDEILHLEVGDVLVLDRRLGEPVELLAGGRTLFEGHLGTARGRLGIRLTARSQ